ncbi:FHA domain-containing protein [Candidatus Uabimicrobium sp. HlEnr_7]|uniref:FHA domain-containing protein n=1 Tax=Candidatus Uabimicrobium helgolandensis TaxID=3095367 RepID=UPI003558D55E
MEKHAPLIVFVSNPEREDKVISYGLTRIGRSSSNEIQINDANVSKAHCILIRDAESNVCIYDFSSRNGTFVGKEKACGQTLKDGDEIILGEHWRLMYADINPSKKALSSDESSHANLVETPPDILSAVEQKEQSSSILPWSVAAIAAICSVILFFSEDYQQISEDLKSKLESSEKELTTSAKKIRNLEKTNSVLQEHEDLLKKSKIRLENQKKTIDKKNNLLQLTQEQLRLVRKQRDRLLDNLDNLANKKQSQANDQPQKEDSSSKAKKQEKAPKKDTQISKVVKPEIPKRAKREKSAEVQEYDVELLKKKLIKVLENYAFPSISPDNLQPMLSQLANIPSQHAAQVMLQLVDYTQELDEELEKNIVFLKKRIDKLFKLANKNKKLSEEELEKHQRFFELSKKKLEIQSKQQKKLISLQQKIVQSFAQLQSQTVTKYLVKKLDRRNEVQCLAILTALSTTKAKHAIKDLIKILPIKNDRIRNKIFTTLSAITNLPFSEEGQWKSWLKKQSD